MHLGYLVGVVWMLATARMLFLPGRIAGSLPVWVWSAWSAVGPGAFVGELGALFCCVECLETREQSLEDALYWFARDEPCSSCGRINSVCRIARDGWELVVLRVETLYLDWSCTE